MKLQCSQSGLAGPVSIAEPASSLEASQPQRSLRLAIETLAVTIVALAVVKALNVQRAQALRWILIPAILVGAALIPTWMARREFPQIGWRGKEVRLALRTVVGVSVVAFPVVFLGLWVLRRIGQPIPLQPAIARRSDWITWLVYQFLYVAVAEEVFFRGYVQANVTRLLACRRWLSQTGRQVVAVVLSAACFAAAHAIVQGRLISLVTFLPGLLLAWLFLRTRSLLAPIVFHGLANVTYGVMTLTLAQFFAA